MERTQDLAMIGLLDHLQDLVSCLGFGGLPIISCEEWTLRALLEDIDQLLVIHIDHLTVAWYVLNFSQELDGLHGFDLCLFQAHARVGPLHAVLHVLKEFFELCI